jgi:glycosyltransferase involved in cell wall biosynthesis
MGIREFDRLFDLQNEGFFFRWFSPRTDVIINNTVANGKVIRNLAALKRPIATYVHELESVIQFYNRNGSSLLTFRYSEFFISPSQAVANNLLSMHNINSEKIFYLNYFVPLETIPGIDKIKAREHLFRGFNIPVGKFCVVGMGTATHRKGIDIFVETCQLVSRVKKDIHFVWIGDFEEEGTRTKTLQTIRQYSVEESLTLTGRIPNSPTNLLPFDLFILTSREDPYPMVILEAASLKLPAICFERSGGAAEFIGKDCGWALPGFSAEGMAEKILELREKPEMIKQAGLRAYEKATVMHTDERLVQNQFDSLIKKIKISEG